MGGEGGADLAHICVPKTPKCNIDRFIVRGSIPRVCSLLHINPLGGSHFQQVIKISCVEHSGDPDFAKLLLSIHVLFWAIGRKLGKMKLAAVFELVAFRYSAVHNADHCFQTV